MTHLEEGTILALRDSLPVTAEQREHVEGCPVCARALEEARSRSRLIEGTLTSLDVPIDLEAARAATRARITPGASGSSAIEARRARSRTGGTGHLRRAAALVLFTAGAASALPGSPVRQWFVGPAREAPPAPAGLVQEATSTGEAGVRVAAAAGRIEISIEGAAAGSVIEVVWIDGESVGVFAGAGSTFASSAGRIEARVTSGAVRIELPRSVPSVSVEVDGRMYVRKAGGALEVPVSAAERTADRLRFFVPTR